MSLQGIVHNNWSKIWAGQWSLLTCSHFGAQWTRILKIYGAHPVTQIAFVVKHGASHCYILTADKEALGKRAAETLAPDIKLAQKLRVDFKIETDKILAFIDFVWDKSLTVEIYRQFWKHIDSYYSLHIINKYAPDYLPPDLLKFYLPILEAARVYAEPVFKRTEEYMNKIAAQIGKREGIKPELLLCALDDEFKSYLGGSILPELSVLRERNEYSTLLITAKRRDLYVGNLAAEAEDALNKIKNSSAVSGNCAYPGKATGKVKIIFDPTKVDNFGVGDILVSPMTRPEYLPLMKQAAAIVTDGGGILCHAAIVARELKKPCVIGTQVATKVFKDGDIVEVDAEKGFVRKL